MLNNFKQYALALLCALPFLASCSTKQAVSTSVMPPTRGAIQHANATIIPGSLQDFLVNVGDTVHFDYNRADILDADKAVLNRQATWLDKYRGVHVTIEGHCDERGTRAYNLALGARRAEGVKSYLISLGVASVRISTISYGKERPICAQSTEACWARNRRAVTAITLGSTVSAGLRS